jgi:hypothetical protein
VEYVLDYVPYEPTRPLLLVDDYAADESPYAGWDNATGNGVLPSDEEHDAFWLDMLSELSSFDPLTDVVEVDNTSNLSVSFLAQYESVVWNVYSDVNQLDPTSLLYRFVAYQPGGFNPVPGPREARLVDLFIAAGGKMLIAGRHPISNTINRGFAYIPRFPFMQLYDHEGRQDVLPDVDDPPGLLSTGYATLCDDVLDYAIATNIRTKRSRCSVQGLRNTGSTRLRDSGMREAIPIDHRFPRLHLHAQTAGVGKYYDPDARGYEAEVYNPRYFFDTCLFATGPRDCFEPIYGVHCLDTAEPTYGAPVAYWLTPEGGWPRSAVFGFSPVYFEPAEVQAAIDVILYDEWGLPRSP